MPSIHLSNAELEEGAPLVHTLDSARRDFRDDGWLLLENAYEPSFITELRRAFFERYGGLAEDELLEIGSQVGHERFMFATDLEPPFFDPGLYANPFVMALVRSLLGDDCVLDSFVFVVAYPGAEAQHLHLDHSLLFPEDESTSMAVPPYALTLVVPLTNLSKETGSTRLFDLGAEAEPSLWQRLVGGRTIEAKMGSCWLMDYRLPHGGTENPGQVPRPILYLVYARKWFTDSENFRSRPPLRLPAEAEIPAAYRALFRRT